MQVLRRSERIDGRTTISKLKNPVRCAHITLAALVMAFGSLSAAPANALSIRVFEYYNTQLDHYFLATPMDADYIDAGNAGEWWLRTGKSFRTSILFGFGEASVCRFYGSFVIGPNSHFFTNDSAECEFLKSLQAATSDQERRWNFEGIPFRTGVPTNGRCDRQPYTREVHRFYNRGFQRGNDSNHRYVMDDATMLEMYGRGWTHEGVVFCVLDGP